MSHSKMKPPSSEDKKISFAPSNRKITDFKNLLKNKKEKRLRKFKKKRENSKKTDGLTAIFGDVKQNAKHSNSTTAKRKSKKVIKEKKGGERVKVKGAKGTSSSRKMKSKK